ncbi:MAG: GtrA family protein [Patescibacteria group bacterium]
MKLKILKFSKYAIVGFLSLLLELGLLFLLVDIFSVYYLVASILTFIIVISVNYFLLRRFVYPETKREIKTGYLIFITMTILGLITVTSGMYLFVDIIKIHYIVARIMISFPIFLTNYFINTKYNFKVEF